MLPHDSKYIKQYQGDPQCNTDQYIQYKNRVQTKPKTNRCRTIFDYQGAGDERKGGGEGDRKKECGRKR